VVAVGSKHMRMATISKLDTHMRFAEENERILLPCATLKKMRQFFERISVLP
jgi:hypothetical protein